MPRLHKGILLKTSEKIEVAKKDDIDGPFSCAGCLEPGCKYRYVGTTETDRQFHFQCVEGANDTNCYIPPCFPRLEFKFSPEMPQGGQVCVLCRRLIRRYHYHCSSEGLYLHPNCARLPQKRREDGHEIILRKSKPKEVCVICNEKQEWWSYDYGSGQLLHLYCTLEKLTEVLEGKGKDINGRGKRPSGSEAGSDRVRDTDVGKGSGGGIGPVDVGKGKEAMGSGGIDIARDALQLFLALVLCAISGDIITPISCFISLAATIWTYIRRR